MGPGRVDRGAGASECRIWDARRGRGVVYPPTLVVVRRQKHGYADEASGRYHDWVPVVGRVIGVRQASLHPGGDGQILDQTCRNRGGRLFGTSQRLPYAMTNRDAGH